MSRRGPSVDGALTTVAIILAGVLLLSIVTIQRSSSNGGQANGALGTTAPYNTSNGAQAPTGQAANSDGTGNVSNAAQTGGGKSVPIGGSGGTGPSSNSTAAIPPAAPGLTCTASGNGGSTDRGVTAKSIKLGATVVQSGIGASFLGQVRLGMNAVKDEVNQGGGICGRQLDLQLIDDGWDAQRGQQFIENLVQGSKVFALAVDPSSEGLRLASNAHYFAQTETPVVGTDGMLNSQYTDPWIWPIAASTVSSMHIMAVDAWKRHDLHQFSIVFDTTYHFGVEGAFAFNAAYKRLSGHDIPGYYDPGSGGSKGCSQRFCGIAAGKTDYSTENKSFNDACFSGNEQCQFVALLMEPNEALGFLRNGFRVGLTMSLAQPLFTTQFASACGAICDGAVVWTGYDPPIEQFQSQAADRAYVAGVRREDANVDVLNQFTEGGYAGMKLLVDALTKVGPDLTRQRLKAVLDSMDYNSGLTTPLQWRPGNHYANTAMRGFAIQYKGNFNGFQSVTGWVKDPYIGQDTGS